MFFRKHGVVSLAMYTQICRKGDTAEVRGMGTVKNACRGLPGGPEIRAPRFHVSGLRFNPWLGK